MKKTPCTYMYIYILIEVNSSIYIILSKRIQRITKDCLHPQIILNGTFVEVVSGKKILGLRILKLSQFKVKSILTRTINYF